MRKTVASIILAVSFILLPFSTTFAQTTVSVTARVPSNVSATLSTLVANLVELPADGTSIVVITATLVDSLGNPLDNKDFELISNRGSIDIIKAYSGNTLTDSPTGTSNSSGIVRFAVRSYAPGQATFSGLAESEVTLDEKPTVTFTPLPAVSNITVTVPVPGGGSITIIQPPKTEEPAPNESSDLTNKALVNTQLEIQIPFWVFLLVAFIILLLPTLIILVGYLIGRVKKGFFLESEYKKREESLLQQIFQLEQQVAQNQQFAYQNDQRISQQIEDTKDELTTEIGKGVEAAIAKVEEKEDNPELTESQV